MLSLFEIDKAYGATRAVKSVTLQAAPGSVLGLVGENGAGKSTLIKIVSGAVVPDGGRLELDGKVIAPRDASEAISLGISGVFQELTLIRELSVERNLLLTGAPLTPWKTIDRRRMRRMAVEIIGRHRLDIDPGARIGDLPLGQQQMIEIVRAAERRPRVLLLDEATSALGASEVDWLSALVAGLRRRQTIVLFISHRWDEVMHFCDRVAILRNGELVSVADATALAADDALRLMTGKQEVEPSFPPKLPSGEAVALAATELRSTVLRGVSLALRKGEILGLGGLVGQGQGSLLQALFGDHPLSGGTIGIAGAAQKRLTPRRAIAAGLAYVPQERKTEGLLLSKSVSVNMTLAILRRLGTVFGIIDPRAERALAIRAVVRAQIRTRGPDEPVGNLSGGNQQKVLLERWLLAKPRILLLNDVTRGVDLGTKRYIYGLIADLARQGVGVVWYSTDARELVGIVHRVVVMLQGRINAELTGGDITVDRIVHASILEARNGAGDARIAG